MTSALDDPEPRASRRMLGPWGERAGRADLLITLLIGVYVAYALVTWPLTPALIGSHPLLLEIVGSSTVAEVTVDVIDRIDHYSTYLTVALVVVLIGLQSRSRRRQLA